MTETARYIHALGHPALTPLYDVAAKFLIRERMVRGRLVEGLALRRGTRVLDVGCGTATLGLMMKRKQPESAVHCIDGDPEIVAMARRKAEKAELALELHVGLATELPFEAGSFDRVTSMLVLHHLTSADKQRSFAEARRVLRPGGEIHIIDVGPPHTRLMRVVSRLLPRHGEFGDNLAGRLPELLETAGFHAVTELGAFATPFGSLHYIRGKRP